MSKIINELIEQLISNDEDLRNNAHLHLSLLIEKTLIPAKDRENERILSQIGLSVFKLSQEEACEALNKVCLLLSDDNLDFGKKIGLVGLLDGFEKIQYYEVILRFLSKYHEKLNDQQIYSILASINPQNLSYEDRVLITELIEKTHLREVLVELKKRNSDKVNDALFHMWGKLKAIGLTTELFNREYTGLSLWYIKNNYCLLASDELNSLIESMPYEYLAQKEPALFRGMIEQYDFVTILSEIEGRTFEDYHNHQIQECPEELSEIIESYDKDEYEQDQKDLTKTISKIRKYL